MTSPGKEELPSQTEAEPTLALPCALLCPWHTHTEAQPHWQPLLRPLRTQAFSPWTLCLRDRCPGTLLTRRGDTFKSLVPYTMRSLSFPLLA